MPRIERHEDEHTTPRPLRRRAVFFMLLLLAATLIYAEMFFRFSQ
ncbi:hypothetical protein [Roseovarius aestuariivivens]|nr:hypothetical protein [Roseovarius aestuariivivens]